MRLPMPMTPKHSAIHNSTFSTKVPKPNWPLQFHTTGAKKALMIVAMVKVLLTKSIKWSLRLKLLRQTK